MKTLSRKYAAKYFLAGVTCLGPSVILAADLHDGHVHESSMSASGATATQQTPALELLMPEDGQCVENPAAVLLATEGDLDEMTMSAKKAGTHLHIGIDEKSLMPTRDQLFSVGKGRYVFVLDLPLESGRHALSVYWAGADHRTILSSVRKTFINVCKP